MEWSGFDATFREDFAKVHPPGAHNGCLLCFSEYDSHPPLWPRWLSSRFGSDNRLQDLAKLFPGPATGHLLQQLKESLFQGAESIDLARYQLWYKRYDLMISLPFWNVVQVRLATTLLLIACLLSSYEGL